MFAWRFALTPLGVANVYYPEVGIGYTNIYLFGLRVARIQRTVPWRIPRNHVTLATDGALDVRTVKGNS